MCKGQLYCIKKSHINPLQWILFIHSPKPDASEDEEKEKSQEEDSESEESDDDSSSGEDEPDAPMRLEQDIIDVSQILSMTT